MIENLVELSKTNSTYQIASIVGCSSSTVRYWLKKLNMKTNFNPDRHKIPNKNRHHAMIDWPFIQKEYDAGKSMKDLHVEYNVCSASFANAKRRGDFKPLSRSEAHRRRIKLKPPRKLTADERQAISVRTKELFKRRPELHPNRKVANNRKIMTYPERLAYDWLILNNIDFIHNAKISTYYVDFLIGKTAIEIDGERWHNREYDDKRDLEIAQLGFNIIRIKAADIVKDKNSQLLQQAVNGKIDREFLAEFRNKNEEEYKIKHFCKCGNEKYRNALECKRCHKCKSKLRLFAQKDELIKKLEETNYNYRAVGRHFNVSDNIIRRRCIKLDIYVRKGNFHPKSSARTSLF